MKVRNTLTGEIIEIDEEQKQKLIEQGLMPSDEEWEKVKGQTEQLQQFFGTAPTATPTAAPTEPATTPAAEPATTPATGETSTGLAPVTLSSEESPYREGGYGGGIGGINLDLKNLPQKAMGLAEWFYPKTSELVGSAARSITTPLGLTEKPGMVQEELAHDASQKEKRRELFEQQPDPEVMFGKPYDQLTEDEKSQFNSAVFDWSRQMSEAMPMLGKSPAGKKLTGAGGEMLAEYVADKFFDAAIKGFVGPAFNKVSDAGKKTLKKFRQGLEDLIIKQSDDAFGLIKKESADKIKDTVMDQVVAQVFQPTKGRIKNTMMRDADKLGINRVFRFIREQAAQNPDLDINVKQFYKKAAEHKKKYGEITEKFLKENADDLPMIDMDKVAADALGDEFQHYMNIKNTDKADIVMKEAQKLADNGKVSFAEAYELAKDFASEVSQFYSSGKTPSEVATARNRIYMLVNNNLRNTMKNSLSEANQAKWSKILDDYFNWSDVYDWAEDATASGLGKIGSATNLLWSRLLPAAMGGSFNEMLLGGVGGATYGAVSPEESVIGGGAKGVGYGLIGKELGPKATKLGKTGAQTSAKALQTLAPTTARSMLQHYIDPTLSEPEEEEDKLNQYQL